MIFKRFFACFLFLLASRCFALEISGQDAKILNTFFREMLEEFEMGYVLFDAKPICIHGYPPEDFFLREYPSHKSFVFLREGAHVISTLPVSNNNIVIHVYSEKDESVDYVHVLFINKKLFLAVVKDNLALFQYVLGPEITPQKLLDQLTNPKASWHSVLSNDRVLIGILLGYGVQNSLYGSRIENIQDSFFAEDIPPFPNKLLKSGDIRKEFKECLVFASAHPIKEELTPGFGFSSIKEELAFLNQKMEAHRGNEYLTLCKL